MTSVLYAIIDLYGMAIQENAPSPEHQKLVGFLISWITKEGYNIECADYDNYSRCTDIGDGSIADVAGYDAVKQLWSYGEAETGDTIDTPHTRQQFTTITTRWMNVGQSSGMKCPFYIAIPEGSEEVLEAVLIELNLINEPHVKWQAFQV